MLATQKQPKGVKYNIQLLMNGWVVAALLWTVGSLIEFLLRSSKSPLPTATASGSRWLAGQWAVSFLLCS